MNKRYFSTERIRLRALEPEDLELLYEMENDPQMWDVTNFSVPYSKYQLKQYIENSESDMFADRQLRLVVVRRADDAVLGTVDIFDYVPLHARGEVGIALRSEFRGQGYAFEALSLLCDYAFGFLLVKQLTAHVAADNEASLQLFRLCGFQPCGLLREWWRVEGEYKDVVLLQKLR